VVLERSSSQPVRKRLTHDSMILGTCEEYPEGRGHMGDEYIQYRKGHKCMGKGQIHYIEVASESEEEEEIRPTPNGDSSSS